MNLNDLVKDERPEKTCVNLTTRRAGEDILGGALIFKGKVNSRSLIDS